MLIRYWQALVNRLDRPGRRLLLTVPGSLWVTFKYRSPCLVYWRDDAWIHHYRGAKIPHESLGRAAPPDVFTAEALCTASTHARNASATTESRLVGAPSAAPGGGTVVVAATDPAA